MSTIRRQLALAAIAAGVVMALTPAVAIARPAQTGEACATEALTEVAETSHIDMDANNPTAAEVADAERRAAQRQETSGITRPAQAPVRIEINFAVLRSTDGTGDVPPRQIQRQVEYLNQVFLGTRFTFALGGIVLYQGLAGLPEVEIYSDQDRQIRDQLHQGDARTLNVYTGIPRSGSTVLTGVATFPSEYASDPTYDGVFVHYQALWGGSMIGRSEGDILVHEIGHWLGLYHTFQGSCDDFPDGGDFVSDTPQQLDSDNKYDCDETLDTCPANGNDPVHNFMNYTEDLCMTNFTAGQWERMSLQWDTWRA